MPESGLFSVGVVTNDKQVFWGDGRYISNPLESIATARRLLDLSTLKLSGQRAASFRELYELLRPIFPPPATVPIADSVRWALQQALLSNVCNDRGVTAAELLADEYCLPPIDPSSFALPLLLEISDFAATSERIDRMFALRPDAIGYRLTGERVLEAIGENGEHLQRFVRELGRKAEVVAGESAYKPAIYLGLNGALGRLTDDPVRHIGKVLGNCIGLQEAAGSRRLILETPVLLDDSIAQSANLLRLKDFIRRTPSTLKRGEPLRLVADASHLADADLQQYADTQSVNALLFDFTAELDIDRSLKRLVFLRESDLNYYLSLNQQGTRSNTPRWVMTAADIAMAGAGAGLIISFNTGSDSDYLIAARYAAETKTWLSSSASSR